MADIIGTTAGIVGLAGTALTLLQEVRKAQEKVKGLTKTFDDTSKQLEGLQRSLALVGSEKRLQTAAVEKESGAVREVMGELRLFLDRLTIEQQKSQPKQFLHALQAGAQDDRKLQVILGRLSQTRQGLIMCISVAQVGLIGNFEDGFRVAFDVLSETNEKVKQTLGVNLALMDRLSTENVDNDGTIPLSASDVNELALGDPRGTTQNGRIYTDNVTTDQAHLMMGDVGVATWRKAAREEKRTVARNQFGNGARIMMGNIDEGATSFNQNFWN